MAVETGITVDCQRRVKNAYVGMLRKRQWSPALWPPGEPELVVGDPLADRTQVERGSMTTCLGFPEKDDQALKRNEQAFYAGVQHDLAAPVYWAGAGALLGVSMIGLGGAGDHPERAEAGDISLAEFLDIWASLVSGECSRSLLAEFVYMCGLGELPGGTEYFSFRQPSGTAEPPVDWDRWHDLRDTMEERPLTVSEQAEYQRFAWIVTQLDAEAARAADVTLDGLVKKHEHVIASIQRLTAAVRAAAEQR